jgi:hypothetical protein
MDWAQLTAMFTGQPVMTPFGHTGCATRCSALRCGTHRRAANMIDDVLPPFRPRIFDVKGGAETCDEPAMIRIHSEGIIPRGWTAPSSASARRDPWSPAKRSDRLFAQTGNGARVATSDGTNRASSGAPPAGVDQVRRETP